MIPYKVRLHKAAHSASTWHTAMSRIFHASGIISKQWTEPEQIVGIINRILHWLSVPVLLPAGELEHASLSRIHGYIELSSGIALFLVQPLGLEYHHIGQGSSHLRLILGQQIPSMSISLSDVEEIFEIEGKFIAQDKTYYPYYDSGHDFPNYRMWGNCLFFFLRDHSPLVETLWHG